MIFIKSLDQVSLEEVKEAGGKAGALGELINLGLPVPSGFVITTEAYGKEITGELEEEIFNALDKLKTAKVAVRSSAISEDSPTSSFAGQLESYLNVTRESLIEAIKKCWESIKSERVLAYVQEKNIPEIDLKVGVVVQKMVDAKAAGVMFTANPVTNNKQEIMIEAVSGLGEALVQGSKTPDSFVLDKNTLEIKSKNMQEKETLSDNQIKELARLGIKIEEYFKKPQDIEWAIEDDQIYILQSRPITTLAN